MSGWSYRFIQSLVATQGVNDLSHLCEEKIESEIWRGLAPMPQGPMWEERGAN